MVTLFRVSDAVVKQKVAESNARVQPLYLSVNLSRWGNDGAALTASKAVTLPAGGLLGAGTAITRLSSSSCRALDLARFKPTPRTSTGVSSNPPSIVAKEIPRPFEGAAPGGWSTPECPCGRKSKNRGRAEMCTSVTHDHKKSCENCIPRYLY